MRHVCGVLWVNEKELVVHVIKLLLAQECVLEHWRLLGPVNYCVVLLVNPVVGNCWIVGKRFFWYAISDVGTNYVSSQRDRELAWEVGKVDAWGRDACLPHSKWVSLDYNESPVKSAHQTLAVSFIFTFSLDCKVELLAQILLILRPHEQVWFIDEIRVNRVLINAQQSAVLDVKVQNCSVWWVVDDGVGISVGTSASIENDSWVVFFSLIGPVSDISAKLTGYVFLVDPKRADSWAFH